VTDTGRVGLNVSKPIVKIDVKFRARQPRDPLAGADNVGVDVAKRSRTKDAKCSTSRAMSADPTR